MEPGCFFNCFSGQNALVQKFGTARLPQKKMIKMITRKAGTRINPQDTFCLNEKKPIRKDPYVNIPKLKNLEAIRKSNTDCQDRKISIHWVAPPEKSTRTGRTLDLQNKSLDIWSARSHKESSEKDKKSSLYGGAQRIIKRMSSFEQKGQSPAQDIFHSYQTNRHFPSLHAPFSFSYESQEMQSTSMQYLDDFNPFLSISLSETKKEQATVLRGSHSLTVGKLLGRGKYCHSFLSQDQQTNSIYTTKYIFKKDLLPFIYTTIMDNLNFVMNMDNSLIISAYSCVEDEEKITVIGQYTPSLLYDEIKEKGTLPIDQVRTLLKEIIEALIAVHQNSRPHNNLSPVQIGYLLGSCKLRISLTNLPSSENYLKDIHSVAMIGYEMAYGLTKIIDRQTPLKDEFAYYQTEQMRSTLVEQLNSKSGHNKSYFYLNSFLLSLLTQDENRRITGSCALNHPFFSAEG